jgi:hypothetical protein
MGRGKHAGNWPGARASPLRVAIAAALTRGFPRLVRRRSRASPGGLPARRANRSWGGPACGGSGRMGAGASRSASGCGAAAARRRRRWPWRGSALRASAGAVDLRLGCWRPGSRRRRGGSGVGTRGGPCSGRLQQHRRVTGPALRPHRRHPDGAEGGWRSGGLQGLVVRPGNQSSATHRLTLPPPAIRRRYGLRAHMEAVSRVCQDHLGWAGGQARAARAPAHQSTCCVGAFGVLERARHDRRRTIDQRKRQLRCRGRPPVLPALERLRHSA